MKPFLNDTPGLFFNVYLYQKKSPMEERTRGAELTEQGFIKSGSL